MEFILQSYDAHLISSLASTLLHFSWQAALIALFLKSILLVTSNNSFHFRYISAILALLMCCIAPIVTFGYFYQDPTIINQGLTLATHGEEIVVQSLSSDMGKDEPKNTYFIEFLGKSINQSYLVLLWAVGVFLTLLKFVIDVQRTYVLSRKDTCPVSAEIQAMVDQIVSQLKITRPVRVVKSGLANVPVVIGWLKPTILLPVAITIGLDKQQLELILAHELAHVKRLDFLVNLIQSTIQVLFFFHPCIYWINRVIREEREYICDSVALKVVGDDQGSRLELAKALLSTAELKEGNLSLIAVAASDGHLKNRITRIVSIERQRLPSLNALLFLVSAIAFSFAAMAATNSIDMVKDNALVLPKTEPSNETQPGVVSDTTFRDLDDGGKAKSKAVDLPAKIAPAKSLERGQSTSDKFNIERIVSKKKSSTLNFTPKTENEKADSHLSELVVDKSKIEQRVKQVPKYVKKNSTDNNSKSDSRTIKNDVTKKPVMELVVDSERRNLNSNRLVKPLKVSKADSSTEKRIIEFQKFIRNSNAESRAVVAKVKLAKELEVEKQALKIALLDAKSHARTEYVEPKALKTPYPAYPAEAYYQKLRGSVKVDFVIDERGNVSNMRFKTDGPHVFVNEIKSKLRRWKYEPAQKDGAYVAHRASMYFEFEVPSNQPYYKVKTGSRIKRL
ncbi:M56 family metallopeptidase [Aliikangiella coralliicola]|uniref:M56 family metallopeptidase n=1 Tax=Aliikangiella coralliicola TaxID=2592383 RepID=A0A545U4S4_9GAMM|nr:M56 family metallopeptidase [Aliikangiella coralliicola]TQV84477.1 M56 family metallopeptidase [Aliikangiella coralliicola]